jgi:hypothetical protein
MTTLHEDKNYYDVDFPMLGAQVTNSVEVLVNTLQEDELQQVYSNTRPIMLAANSTTMVPCVFGSVPVVRANAPVVTTTAGVTLISTETYAWGMNLTFQNTSSQIGSVNTIAVDGVPLVTKGVISVISEDSLSVIEDGRSRVTIDCPFVQTVEYAKSLADEVLHAYSNERQNVTVDARGDIGLTVGDPIDVQTEYNTDLYTIFRQDITWDGALSAKIDGKKL